jgi:tyrosinase
MFSDEAHGDLGFLPWHRAYLLDLERALQAADPAVVLPYWKFDEPAPTLFHPDFLGRSSSTAAPTLSPTNPLLTWQTDGLPGINRRARFDDQTSSADQPGPFRILSETDTIALGPEYTPFIDLEGNPHGYAHTCFSGSIRSIDTAAKDPLFFFLHCNIDRLWAKWQWINQRYDGTKAASFTSTGAAGDPGSTRIGHNRLDTMWPWNGVTSPPRPSTAPRQPFPGSPVVSAPQSKPMVGGLIDFQGEIDAANRLGFAYDDVPYTGP